MNSLLVSLVIKIKTWNRIYNFCKKCRNILKKIILQFYQIKWILIERKKSIAIVSPEYKKLKTFFPFNSHSFFSEDNATSLSFLISKFKCKTIIELGSWLGASTRHIAKCLPEDGLIYAIDHWKGSTEHNNSDRTDLYQLLPTLYDQFLSNCIHSKLTHKIIPKKMTSLDAAKTLKLKADLIFVDAGHDEKSVYQDLVAWYPHLKKDGILCGDDWFWNQTPNKSYSIQEAVNRFAKEKKLYIEIYGSSFWMLKTTKDKILSF